MPMAMAEDLRYVRKANLFEMHPWHSDTLDSEQVCLLGVARCNPTSVLE
jgi:hypothetical protein